MYQFWLRKSPSTVKALLSWGNGLRTSVYDQDHNWLCRPAKLQDWSKILVGIAGLKKPIGDPLCIER